MHRLDLDCKNTIESFEELGMTDPFRTSKSLHEATACIKDFEFYKEVYPNMITGAILEAIKE